MPEYLPFRRPEAAGNTHALGRRASDSGDRTEYDHRQGSDGYQNDLGQFANAEPHDQQRNIGERWDRSDKFEYGIDDIEDRVVAGHCQAEWHTDSGSRQEPDRHTGSARHDILDERRTVETGSQDIEKGLENSSRSRKEHRRNQMRAGYDFPQCHNQADYDQSSDDSACAVADSLVDATVAHIGLLERLEPQLWEFGFHLLCSSSL